MSPSLPLLYTNVSLPCGGALLVSHRRPILQEYGGGSEESRATELALRGRILDQAQRFLLALVVHDPSRRAKCAEEVSRHGLSLGGERRQWLFDFLTAPAAAAPQDGPAAGTPTAAAAPAAAASAAAAAAARGGGAGDLSGASVPSPPPDVAVATHNGAAAAAGGASNEAMIPTIDPAPGSDGEMRRPGVAGSGQHEQQQQQQQGKGPVAAGLVGPSKEALEAGGDTLFAEVRAAAPGGYFALQGAGGGEEAEDPLDWVFDKKEAERVARGTNTDLVLLEVVMVMLKEQVSAVQRSLLALRFCPSTTKSITPANGFTSRGRRELLRESGAELASRMYTLQQSQT